MLEEVGKGRLRRLKKLKWLRGLRRLKWLKEVCSVLSLPKGDVLSLRRPERALS